MKLFGKIGKKIYLLLLLVFSLAVFLRFYQLGQVPSGITNDEANTGYDSYSLLLTGKDQWGVNFPLGFKGFGDYPPPLYRYLSIIPIYFLGLNSFSIRIISAVFGSLSVVAVFFLARRLFDDRTGIASSFLYSIMPWAVGLSRVALESNVAIFFLIMALYYGLANKENIKIKHITISSLFLGLCVYTYSAYTLLSPLVMLIIIADNFYKRKIKLKPFVVPLSIFIILVAPIFINKAAASVRFSQVGLFENINSIGFIDTLNMQRGQCIISISEPVCRILENKTLLFSGIFFKNFLSHFSSHFLYISGTPTQFSTLDKRGLDYLCNFILLIFGFYFMIKKNKRGTSIMLIALLLTSAIPDSLTGDGNFSRASPMQPFIALVSGAGLGYIFSISDRLKSQFKKFSKLIIIAILLFSCVAFFAEYLTYFKNNYSVYSQYGYEELVTNISRYKNKYERIYLSRHLNDAKQYIYYLFYTKYDPRIYQKKVGMKYTYEPGGWISITKIENIYFIERILSLKELKQVRNEKIMLISTPEDFPKDVRPIFKVQDKLGNVIFEGVEVSDVLDLKEKEMLKSL